MNIFSTIGNFFKSLFLTLFGKKSDKVKNKYLFKKGGYAFGLIALVIALVIGLNILVSALSTRFNLDVDLTADKQNSMSEENIDYVKAVDKDINIYLLSASEDDYTSNGYMEYYANQQQYTDPSGDYYKQVVKLLHLYDQYNSHITFSFVDPQGTGFSSITSKFSTDSLYYGDIIVECTLDTEDGNKLNKHKILHFEDIYKGTDADGSAAYGGYYTVNGLALETKLTSAISYVTSAEAKKLGFISGHGGESYFENFKEILEINNYEIVDLSDAVLGEIPSELDAVVICAPTTDFMGNELDTISEFLENDGKLGKNLIYYAETAHQDLPNLKEFLSEWGINFETGIVFESNDSYRVYKDDYQTYYSFSADTDSKLLNSVSYCATGYNVPMYSGTSTYAGRTATTVLTTSSSVVLAPLGTEKSWKPTDDAQKKTYASCIQSVDEDSYNNELVTSSVIAFSSTDFISTAYMQYTSIGNKTISMNTVALATNSQNDTIVFEDKSIKAEGFTSNATAAKVMTALFIYILPIALIIASIVIYFRRKNR